MAFAQKLLDGCAIFAFRPSGGRVPQQGSRLGALFVCGLSQLVSLGLNRLRRSAIRCPKPRRRCSAGRRRRSRQACPRAVDLERHRSGRRRCHALDVVNDLLERVLDDAEFKAAEERQQCRVGGKRRAECVDQPPNQVTVDRLLYPAQKQVEVIGCRT